MLGKFKKKTQHLWNFKSQDWLHCLSSLSVLLIRNVCNLSNSFRSAPSNPIGETGSFSTKALFQRFYGRETKLEMMVVSVKKLSSKWWRLSEKYFFWQNFERYWNWKIFSNPSRSLSLSLALYLGQREDIKRTLFGEGHEILIAAQSQRTRRRSGTYARERKWEKIVALKGVWGLQKL